MIKFLLLSIILIVSTLANAELISSVGVGKGILKANGTLFERVGIIGYQKNINSNLFIRPELGYFGDLSKEGKSSSWVSSLIGAKVLTKSGITNHIAIGPSYLQNPDNTLGGHFQFSLEGGVGLQDNNVSIGLAWKHLSSAGIETPNNGRDFIVLQLGLINI